jgi:hypothetical protein
MLAQLDAHYERYDASADKTTDGWIVHHGIACPLLPHTPVLVRFRDGTESENTTPTRADRWDWTHEVGRKGDIVAYKVIQP